MPYSSGRALLNVLIQGTLYESWGTSTTLSHVCNDLDLPNQRDKVGDTLVTCIGATRVDAHVKGGGTIHFPSSLDVARTRMARVLGLPRDFFPAPTAPKE